MTGLPIAAASVIALVAKATLVLSLALILAWFLRRGSARTVHLLWTTSFAVLLALPMLALLGPSWRVPILPDRGAWGTPPAVEAAVELATSSSSPTETAGSPAASAPVVTDRQPSTASPPTATASREHTPVPIDPVGLAFIIWALGCGAALASTGTAALRFRRLVRQANPIRDPAWIRSADAIRRRLGARADVPILISTQVSTPMTGGVRRPVILLPASAEEWAPDRAAVVLSHELVHVRRRDPLRQLLGRTVVALYWLHPLSWLASRLANIAIERSCDEEVLELGARPSAYAGHLFSLASELTTRPVPLALPLAQHSQLENRMMSILRPNRPRFSGIRTSAVLATVGVLGILAACARPVSRDTAATSSPPVETRVPGDLPGENSAVPVPDPEPPRDVLADRVPPAPHVAELPTQLASAPDPAPTQAEIRKDSGLQTLECNPGNKWNVVRRGEEWTFQQHVAGIRLCMRNRGNVQLVFDSISPQRMDAESWLVLESQADRLHRLVIRPGLGGLEHDWSIDGRAYAFGADAEEWRDIMMTVLARLREAWEMGGKEASLRREIGAHQRHVASLRRQIGSHERHVGSLGRRIGSHERRVASLRRQIGSHERHVASLRRQLASTDSRVASLHQRMARVISLETQEALRATTRALEQLDLRELEAAAQALFEGFDEDGPREWDEDAWHVLDDVLRLREETQNEVGRQLTDMQAEAGRIASERRSVRQTIEQYDLDRRVREIRREIEQYDLDGKVRDIEGQIDQYDLDGKIHGIEERIEQYHLEGKVREIERQIEELDADARVDEIERSIQDEIAALRRLIG